MSLTTCNIIIQLNVHIESLSFLINLSNILSFINQNKLLDITLVWKVLICENILVSKIGWVYQQIIKIRFAYWCLGLALLLLYLIKLNLWCF